VLHAVSVGAITAGTAWHCCLEVYSVATRLPPEFRVSPADAVRLLHEEIFARMTVRELPAGDRPSFLSSLVQEGISGGRIYDAHIAEVARAAGARAIITDNRRHFLVALKHGIRVETPAEFMSAEKRRR